MSDITFVRGYGFPRGSHMDYAGYAGAGCGCGGCAGCSGASPQRLAGLGRAVRIPEPGLFQTIPPLDGYEGAESFGVSLPTLDTATGRWLNDEGQEVDPNTGELIIGAQYRPELMTKPGKGGMFVLLGLGLIGAALFLGK